MLNLKPMEPIKTTQIPQGNEWVHEIKFDGIRGILKYHKGKLELYSKSGNDILNKFPELMDFNNVFNGSSAIIDGELTVWRDNRHSFHDILVRSRSRSAIKIKSNIVTYPLTYVMFDILAYNGTYLANDTLMKRKRILKMCIQQTNCFITSDYYEDGKLLFEKMKALGYEGIVSKRKDSPYVPSKKHQYWYKIKVKKKILTVIGGLKVQGNTIKSLLLGIYKDNQLIYIGSASVGLSQHDRLLFSKNLNILEINDSPFANPISKQSIVFLRPVVTCWVEYLEWTDSGKLRHPQILGFSDLSVSHANGVEYSV